MLQFTQASTLVPPALRTGIRPTVSVSLSRSYWCCDTGGGPAPIRPAHLPARGAEQAGPCIRPLHRATRQPLHGRRLPQRRIQLPAPGPKPGRE